MIFYLFFIIILGNWDYKPHFINKEPKDTAELIWLNEKEEEELAYDWSDNNPNISAKRNYFSVSLAQQACHIYVIANRRRQKS